MEATTQPVTVQANINAPVADVWNKWIAPEHITQWCFASDDWHAPFAENDVRVDGDFKTTMAAKDGSFSFDFGGTYTEVEENRYLAYTMGDGRKVTKELFRDVLDEELMKTKQAMGDDRFAKGKFEIARNLFDKMTTNEEFAEFLTLPGYEKLD